MKETPTADGEQLCTGRSVRQVTAPQRHVGVRNGEHGRREIGGPSSRLPPRMVECVYMDRIGTLQDISWNRSKTSGAT
jgi:hypothetical protein